MFLPSQDTHLTMLHTSLKMLEKCFNHLYFVEILYFLQDVEDFEKEHQSSFSPLCIDSLHFPLTPWCTALTNIR